MQIECLAELTPAQATEWDTFLAASSFQHPRQDRRFAETERCGGAGVRFVIGRENGRVVAVGLLSLEPHRFLKDRYQDAIFLSGPVADSIETMQSFLTEAMVHPGLSDIGQIRVTPYWLEDDARRLDVALSNDGWALSNDGKFRNTGIINIAPEPDEIMSRFSKSARREVRRAERIGVLVRPIEDQDGAIEFLQSLNRLRTSRGLFALDEDSFLQSFEDIYRTGDIGRLLGAFHVDRFVGGLLMYRSAHTAHGRHFATETELLHELKNLRISPLLWLEGMKWARDLGCTGFDVEEYVETDDKSDKKYNIYKYKSELAPKAVIRSGERKYLIRFFTLPGMVRSLPKPWRAGSYVASKGCPMTDRDRLLLECGDEMPSIRPLLSRDPNGGALALFAGRRVKYSFNTRTAIREACDILKLAPGDEVLVPSYNCGSELDPLLDAGLVPKFYKVNRDTRPDLGDIEDKITPSTKAIYLIHYFGMLQPDVMAIRALCDQHGLYLIEDCALSLLSGDKPVEGFAGDVSLFCFYKLLPVVAGGAIVLNSDRLDFGADFDRAPPRSLVLKPYLRLALQTLLGARNIRKLAMRRRRAKRPTPHSPSNTDTDMPAGYYFDPALRHTRLSGYTQNALAGFDVTLVRQKRRENFMSYQRQLRGVPGIKPLFDDLPPADCPLCYPILVGDRDALAEKLNMLGISATPWWSGYNQKLDWDGFEDAQFLKNHILALPCGQHLSEAHIRLVSDEAKRAMGGLSPA